MTTTHVVRRADARVEPMRLIGHLPVSPWDEAKRVALCGADILGIPAFGEYTVCERCTSMWEREFPDWPLA